MENFSKVPFDGDTLQTQFEIRIREELPELQFFFLSDVWLDHPQTLPGIQKTFDNCVENDFIPKIIVMCGNFTSKSITHGNARDVLRYQGGSSYVSTFGPIDFLCRKFRCPRRFDRCLSPHHEVDTFCVYTWTFRYNRQFYTTSKTTSVHTDRQIENPNSKSSFWYKSMSHQIFQPGNCNFP